MIKGKLARTCVLFIAMTVLIFSVVIYALALQCYKNSVFEYIRADTAEIAKDIQNVIGIGTMEYYLENNTTDADYDRIVASIDAYVGTDDITSIEVVKKDILGVYYFYGNSHNMGDHIKYGGSLYGDGKDFYINGNSIELLYEISDDINSYGWIRISKDISPLIAEVQQFSQKLVITVAELAVLQVVVYMFILNKKVIKPIEKIAGALDNYSERNKEDKSDTVEDIVKRKSNYVSGLEIDTNDELEAICDNLRLLEYDVNTYIDSLVDLKIDSEEEKTNLKLLEVISTMQALILRQMYIDFKSVLPILLYYFKADKVIFIDCLSDTEEKSDYDVMVYGSNKKYQKYGTDSMQFSRLNVNSTKYVPDKLKSIIMMGYPEQEQDVDIITFGDLQSKHKWEIVLVKSMLQDSDIEKDIIIKAIRCCVQSFFRQ